jgi:hypothetical protein
MTIWSWLLIGSATWALAILLKILADFLVQRSLGIALHDWVAAILSGVWSSACELGLCALAFWFWNAGFADALVAAVGAALAEFIVLLPAALTAHFSTSQSKVKSRANWSAFFLERAIIFANHIASRALLWLGVGGTGGLSATVSALGLFAGAESIQAYGQAKEWNWLERRTQAMFFVFLSVVILTEVALIFYWW